jgi:hypothetical protein
MYFDPQKRTGKFWHIGEAAWGYGCLPFRLEQCGSRVILVVREMPDTGDLRSCNLPASHRAWPVTFAIQST